MAILETLDPIHMETLFEVMRDMITGWKVNVQQKMNLGDALETKKWCYEEVRNEH